MCLYCLFQQVSELESSPTKSQDDNLSSPVSQDSVMGHIIVDAVDPKGSYVRLRNKDNKVRLFMCE